MLMEGIEKDFVRVIWQVVEATPKTGKAMLVTWLISPVRSAEVLTTFAVMLMGVGDEVERKFVHWMV